MVKRKAQACVYGRKSRENAATLESQINACLDWAKKNEEHIEVVDIFQEEGSASSEDWNRPKLQEMLTRIENLEYDVVIVSEQTRISRTDDFGIFKRIMIEAEAKFVTADNSDIIDFNNPSDGLKVGIQQVVGNYELEQTKKRLKRGTVQSAKKGNYQGKKPPMGYNYNPNTKRLEKNQDAPAVRRMFELYLEGNSTTQISNILNNVEKIVAYHKKKGEMIPITWSKSTVARSLKNVTYAGHTVFGKTKIKKIKNKKQQVKNEQEHFLLIENTHPKEAIVTQEEFDKVQEMLNKKRMQPVALKHAKHTFSGLIACKNCGKHHTFEKQMDTKREWRISSCTTRNYNEDFTKYQMCGNSGCKLGLVEELFYPLLEDIKIKLENYIDYIKQKRTSANDLQKRKEAQKNAKLEHVKKLKRKRKNILNNLEEELYEEDEIVEKKLESKELVQRIKELEQEIETMEIVQEENDAQHVERVLENLNKVLTGKHSSEKEANEILSEFIENIWYEKAGRWAEIRIEVDVKQNLKDILEETKIAITAK